MSVLNFREKNKSNIGDNETDETDKPPNSYRVTKYNLLSAFFSIIFHFVDVFYDYYTAYTYFTTDKYAYFVWTMAFILLPSLVITLISITMYIDDRMESANKKDLDVRTALCIMGIGVQLAPVIRNYDSLNYGRKALKAERSSDKQNQKKYFIKMLNEDSDAALLRVFECYLESAPQQVLQIVLLFLGYIQGSSTYAIMQIVGVMFGFLTMAWCMANYNRCIRFDQYDKQNLSPSGTVVLYFSHLSLTVSRILAVSALATIHLLWTCIAIICHWFIMTVWLAVSTKTTFCCKKIFEVFFTASVSLIYIFNFLNLAEGPTKKSYIIFFSVCFIENIIAVSIWGVQFRSVIKNWSYYIFLIFPVVCFILGVLLLVLYYRSFHPNKLKSGFGVKENNSLIKNVQNAHEQNVNDEQSNSI